MNNQEPQPILNPNYELYYSPTHIQKTIDNGNYFEIVWSNGIVTIEEPPFNKSGWLIEYYTNIPLMNDKNYAIIAWCPRNEIGMQPYPEHRILTKHVPPHHIDMLKEEH